MKLHTPDGYSIQFTNAYRNFFDIGECHSDSVEFTYNYGNGQFFKLTLSFCCDDLHPEGSYNFKIETESGPQNAETEFADEAQDNLQKLLNAKSEARPVAPIIKSLVEFVEAHIKSEREKAEAHAEKVKNYTGVVKALAETLGLETMADILEKLKEASKTEMDFDI